MSKVNSMSVGSSIDAGTIKRPEELELVALISSSIVPVGWATNLPFLRGINVERESVVVVWFVLTKGTSCFLFLFLVSGLFFFPFESTVRRVKKSGLPGLRELILLLDDKKGN